MSKQNKGDLVDMIHANVPGKPVVLAIGDGYNDIQMLQKSDIAIEIVNEKVLMNVGDILTDDLQIVSELIFVTSRTIFLRMI